MRGQEQHDSHEDGVRRYERDDLPEREPMFAVAMVDERGGHPTAVLWIAIAPNGTCYVIDELYGGGMESPEIARIIHQRNAGRTVRGYR